MTPYSVWCKYDPNFTNPLTSRRGQWRVTDSFQRSVGCGHTVHVFRIGDELCMDSTRHYPRGSFFYPSAELRRVLAARKGMQ